MEIVSVIKKPKLTEKTQMMRSFKNPKMTFIVNPKANKNQISNAFKLLFGVWPTSVNVINRKPAPTRFMNKSRKNFSKASKIAYITVKIEDFEALQQQAVTDSQMQEAVDREVEVTATEAPVEAATEEKTAEAEEAPKKQKATKKAKETKEDEEVKAAPKKTKSKKAKEEEEVKE